MGVLCKCTMPWAAAFRNLFTSGHWKLNFRKTPSFFEREKDVPIFYKERQIGFRRVDFLVEENILVELKAVSALTDLHIAQTINYLEAFQLQVGLLINFGEKKLQFKRFLKDLKQ